MHIEFIGTSPSDAHRLWQAWWQQQVGVTVLSRWTIGVGDVPALTDCSRWTLHVHFKRSAIG
jgi:hypothetical protein